MSKIHLMRLWNLLIESKINIYNSLQVMKKFNDYIADTKSNSIIAEFAKRAIPTTFQSGKPADNWTARLFSG